MSQPTVAVYTIGQTPRPDLTEDLVDRFGSVRFQTVGALDGMEREEIPECPPRGYPLETHLQDGTRVVVAASFIEPLLQQAVTDLDSQVSAHLVLCAGHFRSLAAPAPPIGANAVRTPLIQPFDVAVAQLNAQRLRRLDVMVPFADQAVPAMDKWGAAGFACRAHVFAEKPRHRTLSEWLSGLVGRARAQALVFDYVGFPAATLDDVRAAIDIPVLDLGHLAMDALEDTLNTL